RDQRAVARQVDHHDVCPRACGGLARELDAVDGAGDARPVHQVAGDRHDPHAVSSAVVATGPRSSTRSTIIPSVAAHNDATSTPILASSTTSPRNARSVMNNETVNPM